METKPGANSSEQPPRLELPTTEEIKADLRRYLANSGQVLEEQVIEDLALYVRQSVVEALLSRQPSVAAWRLPKNTLRDLQNLG